MCVGKCIATICKRNLLTVFGKVLIGTFCFTSVILTGFPFRWLGLEQRVVESSINLIFLFMCDAGSQARVHVHFHGLLAR